MKPELARMALYTTAASAKAIKKARYISAPLPDWHDRLELLAGLAGHVRFKTGQPTRQLQHGWLFDPLELLHRGAKVYPPLDVRLHQAATRAIAELASSWAIEGLGPYCLARILRVWQAPPSTCPRLVARQEYAYRMIAPKLIQALRQAERDLRLGYAEAYRRLQAGPPAQLMLCPGVPLDLAKYEIVDGTVHAL